MAVVEASKVTISVGLFDGCKETVTKDIFIPTFENMEDNHTGHCLLSTYPLVGILEKLSHIALKK